MSTHSVTVALHSLGCRTNQQEMLALAAQLELHGYTVVGCPEDAERIVVNTCCVTAVAESKTRRALRRLARRAPRARILVTGCMAQHAPHSLATIEQVDWVVCNSRKDDIPGILAGPPTVISAPPTGAPSPGIYPRDRRPREGGRTRFFVKIQEGCSHRCAYCIVPTVRGPSRSVPTEMVERSCEAAIRAGVKEIVLTGTHIGQYAHTNTDVVQLVRRVLALGDDCRVRLSSLDPRELTDNLLALVCEHPRVCEHLHLSVQSLAPSVLHAMGRGGRNADSLVSRLAALRARVPDLALGGDFIVGFPTENAADFERTCECVRTAAFTHGHVFRFSRRPGTPAGELEDRVGDTERKRRSAVLLQLLHDMHGQFVQTQLGRTQRVLIEKSNPCRGLSANYLRVGLGEADMAPNQLVTVRITRPEHAGRLDCRAVVAAAADKTCG